MLTTFDLIIVSMTALVMTIIIYWSLVIMDIFESIHTTRRQYVIFIVTVIIVIISLWGLVIAALWYVPRPQ